MIRHTCGASVPSTIDDFVRHLADCNDGSQPGLTTWAREIVSAVAAFVAMDETRSVSPEMSTTRMAELRDAGKSLRDIAAVSGVAPETVRRRLARLTAGGAS